MEFHKKEQAKRTNAVGKREREREIGKRSSDFIIGRPGDISEIQENGRGEARLHGRRG